MYRILRWGTVGLGLLLVALAFPSAAPAAPALPPATTPTATATPAGEPEWAILQWVAATHPDWNCGPLGGSPGHRVLTGCHPFGYFSHPTDGHVDVYAGPAAAQAAWEALRLHAQQTYPIYLDTPYGPHPGYEGGDTAYPTAYYESYFWGASWVLGAVSSDDTQFRGAPVMTGAIYDAARALGYLDPLTPTPTPPEPTATPTASPTGTVLALCDTFAGSASGSCAPGGLYTVLQYDFRFTTYCYFTQETTATVTLEIAPDPGGPWQSARAYTFRAAWPPGEDRFTGQFLMDPLSPNDWFRFTFSGAPPPAYGEVTAPAPICPNEATPGITATPAATVTPTATQTATASPSATATVPRVATASATPSPSPTQPALCDTFLFDATTTCAGGSYHYRFAFYTYCETETVPATLRLEVAPQQTGPWTLQDQRDFTAVFPPGAAVFEGDFFEPHIPPPAQWYRITFSGAPPPAYGGVAGPALACTAEATPTATPTPPVYCTPAPTPTLCPIRFVDVAEGDYFARPVIYLACAGAISGYADGTFRPYNGTTRAQLVKIVWLAVHGTSLPPGPATATFADVPPGAPFYAVVEAAAAGGLVSGYACGAPGEPCDAANRPYFRPNAGVTRAQVAKVVVRAAGWALYTPANPHFADVPPSDPFYGYVEAALLHGVLSGYTCGGPGEPCDAEQRPYFRRGNPATRGQIAKIVYEVVSRPPACVP